jgi:hypothetical protein
MSPATAAREKKSAAEDPDPPAEPLPTTGGFAVAVVVAEATAVVVVGTAVVGTAVVGAAVVGTAVVGTAVVAVAVAVAVDVAVVGTAVVGTVAVAVAVAVAVGDGDGVGAVDWANAGPLLATRPAAVSAIAANAAATVRCTEERKCNTSP